MSDKLKTALEYAKNVLWRLLVEHERGDINLPPDTLADVDQAQQLAEQSLSNEDEE